MKKFFICSIFILISIISFGQTKDVTETGVSFTLGQPLDPDNIYDYTASEFVNLTGDFHYTPYPGNSFHAVTDPQMVLPPEVGETGGPNPGDDGLVGAIHGGLSVGSNGAANYHIPIEALPGINGMSPNVSLVYNSNGRNGIMGMGWNVAGLSSIQRTGTDIYHEGYVDGVNFDDNDKLMLNGNRLIPDVENETGPRS